VEFRFYISQAGNHKILKQLRLVIIFIIVLVMIEYLLIGFEGLRALNAKDSIIGIKALVTVGYILKYAGLFLIIINILAIIYLLAKLTFNKI